MRLDLVDLPVKGRGRKWVRQEQSTAFQSGKTIFLMLACNRFKLTAPLDCKSCMWHFMPSVFAWFIVF